MTAMLRCWYLVSILTAVDTDRAARELCRTEAEIKRAHEKAGRMGFRARPQGEQEDKSSSCRGASEYTSADIVRRSKGQRISGRYRSGAAQARQSPFNGRAETLFGGIYDYLALPADVIFMLIGYCIDVFTEKIRSRPCPRCAASKGSHGQTRRSSPSSRPTNTYAMPPRALARRRAKPQWGLTAAMSRRPSAVTTLKWFDMGFDNEAILIAYDRTVTNTGSFKMGIHEQDHALVA